MAVHKVSCPECKKVLKSSKPFPVGKKIKCPHCGEPIPIKDSNGEALQGKTSAKTPAPAGKKKVADADEDGPEAYGIRPDAEDEGGSSRKPVDVMPKELPKRKKVEASAIVQNPATFLLWSGILGVLINLFFVVLWLFPVCFSKTMVDLNEVLGPAPDAKGWDLEKLTADQKAKVKAEERPIFWSHIVFAVLNFLDAIYCSFVCHGAVKMQFLESYGWAMTAAIMGFLVLPLTGIWALLTLRNSTVIAGFKEAKRRKVV